jgi:hypothetical protein
MEEILKEILKAGGIFISGGVAVALINGAVKIYTARNQRTEVSQKAPVRIEQPMEVKAAPPPYNKDLCEERHNIIKDQIEKLFLGYNEVKTLSAKVASLDETVDRMDGKLDIIIKNMGAK